MFKNVCCTCKNVSFLLVRPFVLFLFFLFCRSRCLCHLALQNFSFYMKKLFLSILTRACFQLASNSLNSLTELPRDYSAVFFFFFTQLRAFNLKPFQSFQVFKFYVSENRFPLGSQSPVICHCLFFRLFRSSRDNRRMVVSSISFLTLQSANFLTGNLFLGLCSYFGSNFGVSVPKPHNLCSKMFNTKQPIK